MLTTRRLTSEIPTLSMSTLLLSLFIESAEAAPKNSSPRSKPSPVQSEPAPIRQATLVGDADTLGWYVAPAANYSSIRSNDGLLVGAKGGAILDHKLVIGAAAYTFINDAFGASRGMSADLTYGGAYLEYIFRPDSMFHGSVSTLLGGGSANNSFIFVANPAVNGILNLSPSVHLGAEIGYRMTKVAASNRPNSDQFSGMSFGLFVQFGHF